MHWRYDSLQKIKLPNDVKAKGVTASLGTSITWGDDGNPFYLKFKIKVLYLGNAYSFGCDTVGQLGLGLKDDDDKIVPTPSLVKSAHLIGYDVLSVSLSDNHALFLAKQQQ